MEIETEGVFLKYIVCNSTEATYLEKAVEALPARIKLTELTEMGDSPRLFVTSPQGGIMLRPHQCKISSIDFEKGVEIMHWNSELTTVDYKGESYTFLNIPLY